MAVYQILIKSELPSFSDIFIIQINPLLVQSQFLFISSPEVFYTNPFVILFLFIIIHILNVVTHKSSNLIYTLKIQEKDLIVDTLVHFIQSKGIHPPFASVWPRITLFVSIIEYYPIDFVRPQDVFSEFIQLSNVLLKFIIKR